MRDSTIHHPALLGHGGRFAREVRRLCAQAGMQGLFDLPIERDGLRGHTQCELAAVRAFTMLGQAFGLQADALVEWHRLVAYGEVPSFDGILVSDHPNVLPDLLMRAQTLALYQDRAGRGAHFMRAWRHAKQLQRVLAFKHELLMYAPRLMWMVPAVQALAGDSLVGGLRDMRRVLIEQGLSKAGWRWLVSHAPYRREGMLEDEPHLQVALANVFGAIGPHFAPCELFCGYVSGFILEFEELEWPLHDYAWLIQAAWQHFVLIEAKDDRDYFMLAPFNRAMQWILEFGWVFDANQRRAGWPAIERAWRLAAGADRGPLVRWSVPVEPIEHDGLVAYPIDNSHWLWNEGKAMGNCVADLLDDVATGGLLVFVVRDERDKSIAMFSFSSSKEEQPWSRDQCKGRFNRDVTQGRVLGLVERALADLVGA